MIIIQFEVNKHSNSIVKTWLELTIQQQIHSTQTQLLKPGSVMEAGDLLLLQY